jgi:hypothetical protein
MDYNKSFTQLKKLVLLSLIFILIINKKLISQVNSENQNIHNLYTKITDTLKSFSIKRVDLYQLTEYPKFDSAKKSYDTGKKIKEVEKKNVINIISCFKDSTNYLKNNIFKSCSFVPQYLFKIILNKKNFLFILFSENCEQLILVNYNFKLLVSVGELNDKGILELKKYLIE